ncbi:hypothetical protein [Streptomyces sp. NPDC055607]
MTSMDIVMGMGAVMCGSTAVAFFAHMWFGYRLMTRGEPVSAELLHIDGEGCDRSGRYHLVVAFTLPDGVRVEAESRVGKPPAPTSEVLVNGGIGIVYDPARPTRIQIAGFSGKNVLVDLLGAAGSGSTAVMCLGALLT